ncbi:hypothetical protein E1A91_A05G279800v1 [Gossypium mustelinum]|uniref:Uncharacterized protein n=1 Tax=Gossypium mustelinum TaxID=34275 RepID=A0A5D2ZCV3_GOSMU|nr:hypothetical protein E1A91_A05G279800v1 [Gossypium mustelinum]
MVNAICSIDYFKGTRCEPANLKRVLLPWATLFRFLEIPFPLVPNPFPRLELLTRISPLLLFGRELVLLGFKLSWKTTAVCLPGSRFPTASLSSFLIHPSRTGYP